MVREITLGQYVHGRSLLHKADPRMKIVLLTLFIIFVFVSNNFISLGIMAVLCVVAMLLSGVKIKLYIKSLKAIMFLALFTGIINLFTGSGEPLWQWWFLQITPLGIRNAIFYFFRIIILVVVSAALTYTTTPTDLTDAIERLLKPLTLFHVKVQMLAMMMTIALRFIPTLLNETDKIMNAQKARGADMESGNLFKKIKAFIPILIPLFISSFRRAGDLATAMECRCYSVDIKRTRMKVLHIRAQDIATLCVCVVVCAGVVLSNIFLNVF